MCITCNESDSLQGSCENFDAGANAFTCVGTQDIMQCKKLCLSVRHNWRRFVTAWRLPGCFLMWSPSWKNVLKPLTVTLDLLQGEKNCFFGLLKPKLLTLKEKLCEKRAATCFFSNVIGTILAAIDTSFAQLFNSQDAKIATATMSQFCFWWLAGAEREEMCEIFVSELTRLDPGNDAKSNNSSVNSTWSDEGFYRYGPWNASVKGGIADEVCKYLEGTSKTLDCLNDFLKVKRLFLRSNTNGSSAMVATSLCPRGTTWQMNILNNCSSCFTIANSSLWPLIKKHQQQKSNLIWPILNAEYVLLYIKVSYSSQVSRLSVLLMVT